MGRQRSFDAYRRPVRRSAIRLGGSVDLARCSRGSRGGVPDLLPDLAFPGASERVRAFAGLAVANDVRCVVLLSGRNEDGAQLGEQAVYESGTGTRLLTFSQAVAEIAEATGRDMQYVPISAEEFAAAMTEAGLQSQEMRDYTELFTAILDGRSAYLADGVQRALGRAPRDFADWAPATVDTGVWGTSAA